MIVRFKTSSLSIIAFAMMLMYVQIRFVGGAIYAVTTATGMVLALIPVLRSRSRGALSALEATLLGSFLGLEILYALLLMSGDTVNADNFRLLIFGALQLEMLIVIFKFRRDIEFWRRLKIVLALAIGFEFTICALQFSYYLTGIGVQPSTTDYEQYSMVTGSFFNSNDVAVFMVSFGMVLAIMCWAERRAGQLVAVLSIFLIAAFISMSRAAFAISVLFSVVMLAYLVRDSFQAIMKRKSSIVGLGLGVVLLATAGFSLQFMKIGDDSVTARSLDRMDSIATISTDQSVGARGLAYERLVESLPNLGLGSMQASNYDVFFQGTDYSLMKTNPHSFIVEIAFLFGYAGLIVILLMFGALAALIMANRGIPIYLRWVTIVALAVCQGIPSSVLGNATFFIPFVLIAFYPRRSDGSLPRKFNSEVRRP